jgi:predicted permease
MPIVHAAAPLAVAHAPTPGIDGAVLAFTTSVSLLTGLLFGSAPALQAAHVSFVTAVNETGRSGGTSRGSQRTRSALLVAETAIALVVLTSAGLFLRSFVNAMRADPGFVPGHVLTLDLIIPPSTYSDPARKVLLLTEAVERLRAIPGVRAAGGSQCPPLFGVCVDTAFTLADRPVISVVDIPTAASNIVTAGFFDAMGVRLLNGRFFSEADGPNSQFVVIVNQAFVRRHWPAEDVIGKQVREGGPQGHQPYRTVVGVVADVKQSGMDLDPRPEVFLPVTQFPFAPWTELPAMTLAIRTSGDPSTFAQSARRELMTVDRDLPVTGVRTMDEQLSESMARRRFATIALAAFAGVALLLSALGIYGVMAYNVSQSRRELAVRLVLGASPGSIRALVLRRALSPTLLGVLAGWVASLGVTRTISSLLVGVSPIDPVTFSTVAAILLIVSIVATVIPLERRRAIDPAVLVRDS